MLIYIYVCNLWKSPVTNDFLQRMNYFWDLWFFLYARIETSRFAFSFLQKSFALVFLLSSCLDFAIGSFGRCVDRVRWLLEVLLVLHAFSRAARISWVWLSDDVPESIEQFSAFISNHMPVSTQTLPKRRFTYFWLLIWKVVFVALFWLDPKMEILNGRISGYQCKLF